MMLLNRAERAAEAGCKSRTPRSGLTRRNTMLEERISEIDAEAAAKSVSEAVTSGSCKHRA
jgi:hypothetical protein